MTETENRLYAVSLFNRAELECDVQDIAVLARIIPLIEGDAAAMLQRYASNLGPSRTLAAGDVRTTATLISYGLHRPELPPIKPAAASLEGNLK